MGLWDVLMKRPKGGLSSKGTGGPLCPHPSFSLSCRAGPRRNSPRRALWPLSSGRNLLSTAHTRRWSGRLGDLAPTRRKPTGTSMGSLEMETRRRSFPAWQNPRRDGQGSHSVQRVAPHNQDPRGQSWERVWILSATTLTPGPG